MSLFTRAEQGFTLIEVMVGIVLTAILTLGLTGLWAMAADNFIDTAIRQKAIFAINNEVERFVAINSRAYITGGAKDSGDTFQRTTVPNEENIWDTTLTKGNFVTTGPDFNPEQVLYVGGGSNTDRNLVWLDKGDGIVGSIHWRWVRYCTGQSGCTGASSPPDLGLSNGRTFVAVTEATNCHSDTCNYFVFFIRYPYRYDSSTGTLTPSAGSSDESDLQEIELHSIVGLRSG
jgi:prepilin-type N-terminal cleavage/methylation domain-containing protein